MTTWNNEEYVKMEICQYEIVCPCNIFTAQIFLFCNIDINKSYSFVFNLMK